MDIITWLRYFSYQALYHLEERDINQRTRHDMHPAGDVTRVSVMPRKVNENRGCRVSVSVMPR